MSLWSGFFEHEFPNPIAMAVQICYAISTIRGRRLPILDFQTRTHVFLIGQAKHYRSIQTGQSYARFLRQLLHKLQKRNEPLLWQAFAAHRLYRWSLTCLNCNLTEKICQ